MDETPYKKKPGVRTAQITAEDAGIRLDNFLARELKGLPRSRIYRIVRRGEVRVNGGRSRPGHRLEEGDQVRLPPVRLAPRQQTRVPRSLEARLRQAIVAEDERLLVLNKPAGLAVHGGSGLSWGVIEAMRELRSEPTLELVHRLDRDTSGCLMIARRRSELRRLHELIRNGDIDKRYLCLLAGSLKGATVKCEAPLQTTRRGGERHAIVSSNGKPSRTDFRVLERYANATLVEARLYTGRTHQIRAHAEHLGHCVIGDTRYGNDEINKLFRNYGLRRLFLHAHALRFVRPHNEETYQVDAPLDDNLRAVLASLP